MKKGYNYQDKIRKEIWLTQTIIDKLIKKFKVKPYRLKEKMEQILEEAAK